MVSYRRVRVPGGTYFFTLALQDRGSTLLIDQVDALRHAFTRVGDSRPFIIHAIAILPEHLHVLWTLPPGDSDFPARWKAIKSTFTRRIKLNGVQTRANLKNEHDVWQRRYWEHLIVDDTDFAHHVDYIHANPVKHGLVRMARHWRWSSFHRYVRAGLVTADWMGGEDDGVSIGEVE